MTWFDYVIKFQPIVAAFFSLSFVLIYGVRGKWWKSSIGRHMMTFMTGMFILLALAVAFRIWPDIPGRRHISFWSWNLVIFLMAWRAWVAFQVLVLKRYPDLEDAEED